MGFLKSVRFLSSSQMNRATHESANRLVAIPFRSCCYSRTGHVMHAGIILLLLEFRRAMVLGVLEKNVKLSPSRGGQGSAADLITCHRCGTRRVRARATVWRSHSSPDAPQDSNEIITEYSSSYRALLKLCRSNTLVHENPCGVSNSSPDLTRSRANSSAGRPQGFLVLRPP